MSKLDPFQWINEWIAEEEYTPKFGVLATVDPSSTPYTRTIAIREITEKGLLFFTQKGSKKVKHLTRNPAASFTLYLPDHQRQITLRGTATPLSEAENDSYWATYPKESKLRFLVYGPRSGEPIESSSELDEELEHLRKQTPPLSRPEAYVGYRIVPTVFEFYQLNSDRLSNAFIVTQNGPTWTCMRVVP